MATLADADVTIIKAVERCDFYRQRYAEQVAINATLTAECRWLFTEWQPGHPNLTQVLGRIRTLIEAQAQ